MDVIFTDIKQCFDSIWLDEATNDLYDSGVESRNLNLLYEGNRTTSMCVETNFGKTERTDLDKVVMQGSVPGGLICSNQISKICNKLYKEGNYYMYREQIAIPALAMVDDIMEVVECNTAEGLACNIKTDAFIQRKKLESQTGEGKCQWLHIGGDNCASKYYANGSEIDKTNTYKYLGDYIADGLDTLYEKRIEKAHGYSATCLAMSSEISLGYQVVNIAKLLHQSIFLNGTLLNMETWTNCSVTRIEKLEVIEQHLFRKILNAHSKTPIEAIYLEIGVYPLRFHLMKRRIMYLHSILQRDNGEITKEIILLQKRECYKGDFYDQVKNDMNDLGINDCDYQISQNRFKTLLNKKIDDLAFNFLIEKAKTHSKVNESAYENGHGVEYLKVPQFTPDLSQLLFAFRTRCFLVKNNFRNNYKNTNILCPLCEEKDDTQEHIFECKNIKSIYRDESKYEDIFSKDMEVLLQTAKTLKTLVQVRELLLEEL